MKILVLSDSHGHTETMCCIIDREKPDYLIHLGDYTKDSEYIRQKYPFLSVGNVRGNCDICDFDTPEYLCTSYDSTRVMAVHGHQYGVKNSLLRLYMSAKENMVQVALFGHTHHAYCELKDGVWLLNPGSCSDKRRSTYGIIEISDNKLLCSVNDLCEGECDT